MKKWPQAFRLRTLPLSLSTIFMGGALASYLNPDLVFNRVSFTLAIITTIFLQILSNLANDYGDFEKGTDNDERVGPVRTMQGGLISKKEMKRALILFSVLTLISGLALLYLSFGSFDWKFIGLFIIGLLAIIAALKYTMGKSAYGYRGLGDVFVLIFFGFVGVGGTYFLLVQDFNYWVLLPSITMGLLATAVLNLNNMRDIVNDEKAGKRTLVVMLGLKGAKNYHTLIFFIAYTALFLFQYFIINNVWWISLTLIPFLLIHYIHLKKVYKITDPKDFDPYLKVIALSTFALSLVFGTVLFIY